MKKTKNIPLRVLLFFVVIAAILSSPQLFTKAETSGSYNYLLKSDGTVEITGYTGNDTELIIPYEIDGYYVTSIGNSAFSGRRTLMSVVIPEGVTSIGDNAFYKCNSLASITIPKNVTRIGQYAFFECNSLTSIMIPESVSVIETHTFHGCSNLAEIIVPNGLTRIEVRAFSGCNSLTSVMIPEGVTYLGDMVFEECSSLLSISLPEGVTRIGNYEFYGCSSLRSVTIPESVTSIGEYAFTGCSSLISITLPQNLTGIGNSAFSNCSSLTSMDLPKTVNSIGDTVFYGCSNLTSITLPEGITSIGNSAFADCSSLTSIALPKSITSIGDGAFSGCNCLTGITIPESIINIGNYAFSSCSGLTSVALPESVVSIGTGVFSRCTNLSSITIPDGVASIESYAFYGCSSLTSITIPEGLTSIGGYSFSGCRSLTCLSIPESVKRIGDFAFNECSSLMSVTIPDGVQFILSSTFSKCSSLKSIIIPKDVTIIGDYAFSGCTSLTSIVIPDGITRIGVGAFSGVADNYMVYCFPETYTANYFDESHIQFIYSNDSGTVNHDYLGFKTDRIILTPNTTTELTNFLMTNQALENCKVSVSDESLFFYDNGMIAVLGEGSGTLSVTYGDLKATVKLISTFDEIDTTGISMSQSEMRMAKGESCVLTVTLSPDNATMNEILWSSSDESVALVNNGVVTSTGEGNATITATLVNDSEISASCEVLVKNPLKAILTFEELQPYTVQVDRIQKIQYYLYPSDAQDVALTYTSSNPDILSVDENGTMTAHEVGTVQVTISSEDISKTVDVSTYAYIPLEGLSLDQAMVRAKCGDQIQLTAIYDPADTTETDIVWSSDAENVATVDETGLVTVHGRGIANVTIISTDGKYSAKCTFVCNEHNWNEGEITTTPTCTEKGTKTYTCVCGESYTEELPAAGHNLIRHDATEADYWYDGNIEYWECEYCGEFFADESGVSIIEKDSWIIPKLIPDDGWITIDDEIYYYENGVEKTGWQKLDGKWYYFAPSNGVRLSGFVNIKGKIYYMNSETGIMQTGWIKDNDIWYYADTSGAIMTGWVKVGTTWYYMNASGAMVTGWVKVGNTWYYMNASGAMTTGWVKSGGAWYYMNASGAMVTGWVKVGNTWYFMKPSGVMAASEWYDGYWLSASGAWTYQAKGSWKQSGGRWWFGDTSGWYAKNETLKINDKYYTFDASGYLVG